MKHRFLVSAVFSLSTLACCYALAEEEGVLIASTAPLEEGEEVSASSPSAAASALDQSDSPAPEEAVGSDDPQVVAESAPTEDRAFPFKGKLFLVEKPHDEGTVIAHGVLAPAADPQKGGFVFMLSGNEGRVLKEIPVASSTAPKGMRVLTGETEQAALAQLGFAPKKSVTQPAAPASAAPSVTLPAPVSVASASPSSTLPLSDVVAQADEAVEKIQAPTAENYSLQAVLDVSKQMPRQQQASSTRLVALASAASSVTLPVPVSAVTAASPSVSVSSSEVVTLAQKIDQTQHVLSEQAAKQQLLEGQLAQAQVLVQSQKAGEDARTALLKKEAESAALRTQELAAENARLQKTLLEAQKAHQEQLVQLSLEAQAAVQKAETARQSAILDASRQMAEAERLALEAQASRQKLIETEAMRLRREADDAVRRAQELELVQRKSVGASASVPPVERPSTAPVVKKEVLPLPTPVVEATTVASVQAPVVSASASATAAPVVATAPSFEEAPLSLYEKDKTLEQIMVSAVGGKTGLSVEWQLSDKNKKVMQEKWTVIAETKRGAFLDYVVKKVKETHSVTLRFNRFDGKKLFVISEE